MLSLLSAIRCGGIGVITHSAGEAAGVGHSHIMVGADTIPVTGAAAGAVIGDIIITDLAGAGVAVAAVIGLTILTIIIVVQIMVIAVEAHVALLILQKEAVE